MIFSDSCWDSRTLPVYKRVSTIYTGIYGWNTTGTGGTGSLMTYMTGSAWLVIIIIQYISCWISERWWCIRMHVMGSPTYGPAGTAAGYVPVQQYGTRDPRAARWWYRRTTIPVYLRLCNSNGYYYGRSGFSFGTLQQQYHYRPVVTADGFFRIIMMMAAGNSKISKN